jgi:hypothetical protein
MENSDFLLESELKRRQGKSWITELIEDYNKSAPTELQVKILKRRKYQKHNEITGIWIDDPINFELK